MKKIFVLLFALLIGFTLVACTDKDARLELEDLKDQLENVEKDYQDKLDELEKDFQDKLDQIVIDYEKELNDLIDEVEDMEKELQNQINVSETLINLNHEIASFTEIEVEAKDFDKLLDLDLFNEELSGQSSTVEQTITLVTESKNIKLVDGTKLAFIPGGITGSELKVALKYEFNVKGDTRKVVKAVEVTIERKADIFSYVALEGLLAHEQHATHANYRDMNRTVWGTVAGINTHVNAAGEKESYYKLVDESVEWYLRVTADENFEVGDFIIASGNLYPEQAGLYFSPKLGVFNLDTTVEGGYAIEVSKGNDVDLDTQKYLISNFVDFTGSDKADTRYAAGYDLTLTGRVFVDTVNRFENGAQDGDEYVPTKVVFMEFAGQTVEFYGLSAAQITAFEALQDKYVTLDASFAWYELFHGAQLNRVQLLTDVNEVEVLTSAQIKSTYEDYFKSRFLDENILLGEDVAIYLPTSIVDAGYDADKEILRANWTFTGENHAGSTGNNVVNILAPAEKRTTTVKVVVDVLDVNAAEEAYMSFELERTFVTQSNEISHTEVDLIGYTVTTGDGVLNFLEGMLKDDEDSYWDDWTYARQSNQDDANKIIDGDRDSQFHIEIEQTLLAGGYSDPVTFEFKFNDMYDFTRVVVDAGMSGGDKFKDFFVQAYNYDTEEWVKVGGVRTNRDTTQDQTYLDIDFDTDLLRVSIENGTHNHWACCYHVYISEIIFYGDKVTK